MKFQGWMSVAVFGGALAAGSATAGTSAEGVVLPGEKVRGAFSQAGETKTMALAVVRGAKIALTVKAVKGSRVTPRLKLTDAVGAGIDLADFEKGSERKRRIKGVPAAATGIWRLRVNTKVGSGGDFEVRYKAKGPKSFKFAEETQDDTTPVDLAFAALPGSLATVKVSGKGKTRWRPVVEILAPDGTSLATTAAAKAASLKKIPLPELGVYTLRVTGGPGPFKATVKIKPPRGKRALDFADVEALPEVTGFSPDPVENDGVATIRIDGFGFGPEHTLRVLDGQTVVALAAVEGIAPDHAAVPVDLAFVAPGTYSVSIGSPSGRSLVLDDTLDVVNRVPDPVLAIPSAVPLGAGVEFGLFGRGFDEGSTVTLNRTSDGLQAPAQVTARVDHSELTVSTSPLQYGVGPYDVTVTDPGAGAGTRVGVIDVLGRAGPSSGLTTYTGGDAAEWVYVSDTAFNATQGTLLVVSQKGSGNILLQLVDGDTRELLQSVAFDGGAQGTYFNPKAAWDPVNDTFCIVWRRFTTSPSSRIADCRVVAGDDITQVLGQGQLANDAVDSSVSVAGNPDSGGFLTSWVVFSDPEARVMVQSVAGDGVVNTSDLRTVRQHPLGLLFDTAVSYYRNGSFVVVFTGYNAEDRFRALHRSVVASDGSGVHDPVQLASSAFWFSLSTPVLVRDPDEGNVLVGITTTDFTGRPHAEYMMLVSSDARSRDGARLSLDFDAEIPAGVFHHVQWSPVREEFVTTVGIAGGRIAVRRVGRDGVVLAAPTVESYEARVVAIGSGPADGHMMFLVVGDGVDDGAFDPATQFAEIRVAPYR